MSDIGPAERVETKEERKARKAAKKQAKADKLGSSHDTSQIVDSEKTSKKSKKRKAQDAAPTKEPSAASAAADSVQDESQGQDKKKRKTQQEAATEVVEPSVDATAPTETIGEENEDSVKKGPKRKRSKSKKNKSAAAQAKAPEEDDAGANEPMAEATASGPKEQATEPLQDGDLNEQAQKGLHYAFTYKANRSDPSVVWKFNKARQIWLSKNIWQPEVIPSKWVELTINYLKTIQGIARKHMIEDAKKRLTVTRPDPAPESTAEETTKDNAQDVIEASDATPEARGAETAEESGQVENGESLADLEEIRSRAKLLLEALNEST